MEYKAFANGELIGTYTGPIPSLALNPKVVIKIGEVEFEVTGIFAAPNKKDVPPYLHVRRHENEP